MTPEGVTQMVRDDCMDFLTRHARHRLETLRPTNAHGLHTGALWDALAPVYWEVSDGERMAVIEGRRTQMGGPLCYELRPGRIVAERVGVEIPDDEIRRHVDRALYPGVAPERKLAAFAETFKQIVWSLDPESFEILYDVPGDPTLAVARLPEAASGVLREAARRIFDAGDSAKVVACFAGGGDDPDGFTVLVRQNVRVDD